MSVVVTQDEKSTHFEMKLDVGLTADPLSKQLAGYISTEDGKALDADWEAIGVCFVRGYLNEAARSRAVKKLAHRCSQAVNKFHTRGGN